MDDGRIQDIYSGKDVEHLKYSYVSFQMMWFTPLFGTIGVLIVSLTAAAVSLRPVLKL